MKVQKTRGVEKNETQLWRVVGWGKIGDLPDNHPGPYKGEGPGGVGPDEEQMHNEDRTCSSRDGCHLDNETATVRVHRDSYT